MLLTSPKLSNTKGPSCCEAQELHWLHSSTEHAQRNTLHTAPAQQFWNWYCRHHSPQISNIVMITPFVLRLCFPHLKVTYFPHVCPSSCPFFKEKKLLPLGSSSFFCINSWCCLSVNHQVYSKHHCLLTNHLWYFKMQNLHPQNLKTKGRFRSNAK